MSDSVQQLVNRAIFLSTETQAHFGRLIADAEWEVEFTSSPRLTFTGESPLSTRAHLVGTADSGSRSWHWGWDNPNGFPGPVVALSHAVRRHGAEHGISDLTVDEIDADEETPLRLTLAAKAISGRWAHYPASAGGTTVVWMLVEAAELELGAPQIRTVVRSLAQGLTETTVTDHREALQAYSEARGFPLAMLPDGRLRILCADGWADVTFDEQNRITDCQLHTPLEEEAAEQFASTPAPVPPLPPELPGADDPEPAQASPADSADEQPATEAPAAQQPAAEEPPAQVPAAEVTADAAAADAVPASPEAQTPDASPEAPAGPSTHAPEAGPEPAAETTEPQPSSPAESLTPLPTEEKEASRAEEKSAKRGGFFKKLFGR